MTGKYRLYLDNCCYNRPYDDQSQYQVLVETQAVLFIYQQISLGKIELATSYITDIENEANKFEIKRVNIKQFMESYTKVHVDEADREHIESIAAEFIKSGLRLMDAYHVACAIFAGCDYFLSTDYRLLKFRTDKIKILNPIDFIIEEEMIL